MDPHDEDTPEYDNVNVKRLNEDLYSVLMDKTEGEAWQRVKSVHAGNGLEAFVKVYKWCRGTSGQGLSEKARIIMSPVTPKSAADMAEALDKWLEGLRHIMGHKGYEMSVKLRGTTLNNLMVGRARDLYEDWVDSLVKQDTDM